MGNDQSHHGCNPQNQHQHQRHCANGVQGWHSNKHAVRGARRAIRNEERAERRASRRGAPAPVPIAGDPFPWHLVVKHQKIGMGEAKLALGKRVKVGFASVNVAVCRDLHVGFGSVNKAIVFDKVHVGLGAITELHCLASTLLTVRLGGVDRVVYHSAEELALLASAETGVPVAVTVPPQGRYVASTTTTTTVVPPTVQTGHYAPAGASASGPYASGAGGAASDMAPPYTPYTSQAPLGAMVNGPPPQEMPPRYDEVTPEKYTLA